MTRRSDNPEIAVLQQQGETVATNIQEIKADIKSIKDFIFAMNESYVTRKEFDEYRSGNWARNTLSAIAGAAITAVVGAVIYFIIGN